MGSVTYCAIIYEPSSGGTPANFTLKSSITEGSTAIAGVDYVDEGDVLLDFSTGNERQCIAIDFRNIIPGIGKTILFELTPVSSDPSIVVTIPEANKQSGVIIHGDDATLRELSLSDTASNAVALSPTFASSTLVYNANVLSSVLNVDVRAVVNDRGGVFVPPASGGGERSNPAIYNVMVNDAPSGDSVNLIEGVNVVEIIVTPGDRVSETKTYTININRASSDANLSELTIPSALSISPPDFASSTLSYSANIVSNDRNVDIRITANHPRAVITRGDNVISSGVDTVNVDVGTTTIIYIVTAEDGIATKEYTFIISRQSVNLAFTTEPSIISDNPREGGSSITEGALLTLTFSVNQALETDPIVTISGQTATVVKGTGNDYTATYIVVASEVTDGAVVTYDIGEMVAAADANNTFDPAVANAAIQFVLNPPLASFNTLSALTVNMPATVRFEVGSPGIFEDEIVASDFTAVNARELSVRIIQSNSNYELTFTPVAPGTVTITFNGDRVTGNAGNLIASTSVTAIIPPTETPIIALFEDTGVDDDGITNNGQITVSNLEDSATWQYSTNSGASFTQGGAISSGASSFVLAEGVYSANQVQVRQITSGVTSTIASLSEITVDTTLPIIAIANPMLNIARDTSYIPTATINERGTLEISGDTLNTGVLGTYNITFTATDIAANSATATQVIIVGPTTPSAPRDLSATPGNGEVSLSWNVPDDDGDSPITGYQIASKTDDDGFTIFKDILGSNAETQTYTAIGLTGGVTYTFKILAINSVGDGAESNEASAVPAVLTQVSVGYEFSNLTSNKEMGSVTYCTTIYEPSSGGTPANFTLKSSITEGSTAIAGVDYVDLGDVLLDFSTGNERQCATIEFRNIIPGIGKTILFELTPVSSDPSIVVTIPEANKQSGVLINGNDATLRELSLSDTASNAVALTPAFASSTLTYNANVLSSATSIDVRAIVNDRGGVFVPPASGGSERSGSAVYNVMVNDAPSGDSVNLAEGANVVEIIVTPGDRVSETKTYTININRVVQSADNYLSDLMLENEARETISLDPLFTSSTTEYSANIRGDEVFVIPTTRAASATVSVDGILVQSGTRSEEAMLDVGNNIIHILVTASNGASRTYTLNVNRASSDADLSELTIPSALFISPPSFASSTLSYSADVGILNRNVEIRIAANHPRAVITRDGNIISSGVDTVNVGVGTTTVTYIVTAEDGIATKEYTFIISRPAEEPIANAGFNQNVYSGESVTLNSSASSGNEDGDIEHYGWIQTHGATVTLSGADTAIATFIAPDVVDTDRLIFELSVTSTAGSGDRDTVLITVNPALSFSDIIGIQTYTVGEEITSLTLPIATGGRSPLTYTLESLPNGLSFDADSRILSGTPTLAGTSNVIYTVTDDRGVSVALEFVIDVITADNALPTIALFEDTGVDNDGITNNGQIVVSNLEDGATWQYSTSSGASFTQGGAISSGASSFVLAEGVYSANQVQVRQITSGVTSTIVFFLSEITVDTTLPIIAIANPMLNIARDTSYIPTATINERGTLEILGDTLNTGVLGTYNIIFTATDIAANSATATQVIIVGPTTPSAPRNLSATPGNGEVSLSWNVPDDDGDSPITGYQIASKTGNSNFTIFKDILGSSAETQTYTAIGLTGGVTYTFKILAINSVGDGAESNEASAVPMAPLNTEPTANAGDNQSTISGTEVTLNGSASSDSEDDAASTALSYNWVQTSGTNVTLSSEDTAIATFTAPDVDAETTLIFTLTVTDSDGASSNDEVTITVQPLPNTEPTANAGDNQSTIPGAEVTLDGSASSDSEDDAASTALSYNWAQTSGTNVTLSSTNTITATFTAPDVDAETALVFTLTVTDSDGASSNAEVTINVQPIPIVPLPTNTEPTANAGDNQSTISGAEVTLDGSASSDSEDDAASTDLSYNWVQTSGATVTLSSTNTITATFTALDVDAETALIFTLTVTDSDGASSNAEVTITVQPIPNTEPTANAGDNQSTISGAEVTLDGSASSDSEDDAASTALSYNWAQISGTTVTLSSEDTAIATFTAPDVDAETTLVFTLTVTDSDSGIGSDTVEVVVMPFTVTFPELGESTVGNSASVKMTFSTAVNGLTRDDFETTNASVDNITGSATTYTITYTPTSVGSVELTLKADSVIISNNVMGPAISIPSSGEAIMAQEESLASPRFKSDMTIEGITTAQFDKMLFRQGMADLLGINIDDVRVLSISAGSVVVNFEIIAQTTQALNMLIGTYNTATAAASETQLLAATRQPEATGVSTTAPVTPEVATPPVAPTLDAAPRDSGVILSWNTPDDGGAPITGYKLARKEANGAFSNFESIVGSNAGTTEYTVMGLKSGVTYTFKILATNIAGDGAESPVALLL